MILNSFGLTDGGVESTPGCVATGSTVRRRDIGASGLGMGGDGACVTSKDSGCVVVGETDS